MRAESIFKYERGQSAMVYYTCSQDDEPLCDFMTRCGDAFVSHARANGACLIRYGETQNPKRELARLLRNFQDRFGSQPIGNHASNDVRP